MRNPGLYPQSLAWFSSNRNFTQSRHHTFNKSLDKILLERTFGGMLLFSPVVPSLSPFGQLAVSPSPWLIACLWWVGFLVATTLSVVVVSLFADLLSSCTPYVWTLSTFSSMKLCTSWPALLLTVPQAARYKQPYYEIVSRVVYSSVLIMHSRKGINYLIWF